MQILLLAVSACLLIFFGRFTTDRLFYACNKMNFSIAFLKGVRYTEKKRVSIHLLSNALGIIIFTLLLQIIL